MDFTKVVSDGYASGESTYSADTGVCCCLAWRLTKACQAGIRKEQLRALHLEIQSFRELLGATAVEVAASHGALQCKDSRHLAISAEDVALRLGQLLCVWCAQQEPCIEITVGMHTGGLDIIHLPGGSKLYVGSSLHGATELANDDYYEFTPGILRGLCDPEHLKSLQVPLAEAFKGYTLRHVRGQAPEPGQNWAGLQPLVTPR
ncbi:unnamed protein product [Effrenium voratum]|uniref:Uncharacterized protein n=1 Tax=Effrenium voratum TaxID=2562239 RepID=A0AA36NHY1_9DINO|nr:unnamed protein product [Effrenium voratum]